MLWSIRSEQELMMRGRILGERALTLRRISPGSYVGRRFVAGATAEFTIYGYVEPAPAEMVESLEDAQRSKSPKLVITKTQLKVLNESDQTPADQLIIDGVVHEVMSVEPIEHTLPHWEVIAIRVDRS